MTEEEIIEEIKGHLGYPVVKIEISDEQWPMIIRRAKRWFRSRKGLIGCYRFPVTGGDGSYDLPEDSYSVVDVVTPGTFKYADLFGWCGLTDLIPVNQFGLGGGLGGGFSASMFDASSYVMILQSLDTRAKALGLDRSWFEACGKLNIHSVSSGLALLFFKRKAWDVSELVGRDEDMFFRYCLAITKEVIGRIRLKYSNYPTAGGSITMDGDTLYSDAKEEITSLDEEIFGSQGNTGGILKG